MPVKKRIPFSFARGIAAFRKNSVWYFFSRTPVYIRELYNHFIDDDFIFLASGIAFNVLLCIIPIMLVASSVVGALLQSSQIAADNVDRFIKQIFPNQPHSIYWRTLATHLVTDLLRYQTQMGVFGFFVLIYTASSLFSSIRSALHRIHPRSRRKNVIWNQIKDLLIVVSTGFLFIAVNTMQWLYGLILTAGSFIFKIPVFDTVPFVPVFFRTIASISFAFLMALMAYRYIPYEKMKIESNLLSAATSTFLWVLVSRGFAFYLYTYQPYSELFGAYAFILATMTWIFISSVIFLIGGAVGEIHDRHQNKNAGGTTSGSTRR